jgi:hypothetical protein
MGRFAGVVAREVFDRRALHRAQEWLDRQVLSRYPTSPYAKVRRLLRDSVKADTAGDRALHRIRRAHDILAKRRRRR